MLRKRRRRPWPSPGRSTSRTRVAQFGYIADRCFISGSCDRACDTGRKPRTFAVCAPNAKRDNTRCAGACNPCRHFAWKNDDIMPARQYRRILTRQKAASSCTGCVGSARARRRVRPSPQACAKPQQPPVVREVDACQFGMRCAAGRSRRRTCRHLGLVNRTSERRSQPGRVPRTDRAFRPKQTVVCRLQTGPIV